MRKMAALVVIAACGMGDAHDRTQCDASWNFPESRTCESACATRPISEVMACVASHPSTTAKHECLGTFVYDDQRGCCGELADVPNLIGFYVCD